MEKQLTLRGVDEALDARLRAEAVRRGWSINRTALQLLRQATGSGQVEPENQGLEATGQAVDLGHLAGTWPDEEADAFDRTLSALRKVDPELWS